MNNREMTGWTFEEGKQMDIRNEMLISDLERERMNKLDQLIGTNTHFHEIESFEERLDSETVMEKLGYEKYAKISSDSDALEKKLSEIWP